MKDRFNQGISSHDRRRTAAIGIFAIALILTVVIACMAGSVFSAELSSDFVSVELAATPEFYKESSITLEADINWQDPASLPEGYTWDAPESIQYSWTVEYSGEGTDASVKGVGTNTQIDPLTFTSTSTQPVTGLIEGTYTFSLTVTRGYTDDEATVYNYQSIVSTVVKVDQTQPQVSDVGYYTLAGGIETANTGWLCRDSELVVRFTVDEANIDMSNSVTNVMFDGMLVGYTLRDDGEGQYSVQIPAASLISTDGAKSIIGGRIQIYDKADNVTVFPLSRELGRDIEAPVLDNISFTADITPKYTDSVNDLDYYGGDTVFSLSASLTDATSGVDASSIVVTIGGMTPDNVVYNNETNELTASISASTIGSKNGISCAVSVSDKAGNVRGSATVSTIDNAVIDATAPSLTSFSPTTNLTDNSSANYTFSAADNAEGSGIDWSRCVVTGMPIGVSVASTATDGVYRISVSDNAAAVDGAALFTGITLYDKVGNSVSTTTPNPPKYIKALSKANVVNVEVLSPDDSIIHAGDNDVSIRITVSHLVDITGSINGESFSGTGASVYTFTHEVPASTTDLKQIPYSFTISDNISTQVVKSGITGTYYDQYTINASCSSSGTSLIDGNKYIVAGSSVTVRIGTDNNHPFVATVTLGNAVRNNISVTGPTDVVFSYADIINASTPDGLINYSVSASDPAGIAGSVATTSAQVYLDTTNPTISDIGYSAVRNSLNAGKTFDVTVTASDGGSGIDSVMVVLDEQNYEAVHTSGNLYVAEGVEVPADYGAHLADILLDSCTVTDKIGNSTDAGNSLLDTGFEYYEELTLGNIVFTTNNATSPYITVGDNATVTFTVNHALSEIPEVKIGNIAVTASTDDNVNYTAFYTVAAAAFTHGDAIGCTITVKDAAASEKDGSAAASLTYVEPIAISSVNVADSNDRVENFVMDGDIISFTVVTNHPIKSGKVTLTDGTTPVEKTLSGSGTTYTAQFRVGADYDAQYAESTLTYTVLVDDVAGNDDTDSGSTAKTVDRTPPTLVSAATQNGVAYAKAGDEFTVSVKLSDNGSGIDTASLQDVSIKPVGGVSVDAVYDSTASAFIATISVPSGLIDCSTMSFDITALDIVGNELTSRYASDIVFYRDVNINNAAIKTDNLALTHTKDGDIITVTVKTNHPITCGEDGSRVVLTDSASNSKEARLAATDGTNTYSTTFTVGNFVDGALKYSVYVFDDAGNTDESLNISAAITVDNTKPTLVSYSFSKKYLKDAATFNIDFTLSDAGSRVCTSAIDDTVIAPVITVNGQQYNGCVLRSSSGSNVVYRLSGVETPVSLLDETQLTISIKFFDKAGNDTTANMDDPDDTPVYYAEISTKDITLKEVGTATDDIVKNGNYIALTFKVNHPVTITTSSAYCVTSTGKTTEGPVALSGADAGWYQYCVTWKVAGSAANDNLGFGYLLVLNDAAQNPTLQDDSRADVFVTYYAPIAVTNLAFNDYITGEGVESRNIVKDGDLVKLTFTTKHEVICSASTVSTSSAKVVAADNADIAYVKNGANFDYTITWEVSASMADDLEKFGYTLTVSDVAENTSVTKVCDSASLKKYYAPLVVTVTFANDDNRTKDTALYGQRYVMDENTLTMSVAVNHAIELSDTTFSVGGTEVTLRDTTTNQEASKVYTASMVIRNEADMPLNSTDLNIDQADGNINYTFDTRDVAYNLKNADNVYSTIKQDTTKPEYDTQTPLTYTKSATVATANNYQEVVRRGDTVTVTFRLKDAETICDADVSVALMGGRTEATLAAVVTNRAIARSNALDVTASDGIEYTTSFEIPDTFQYMDNRNLTFSITAADDAGNSDTYIINTGTPIYYAPLSSAYSATFRSTNARTPAHAMKVGETINLVVTMSHPVQAGQTGNVTFYYNGVPVNGLELTPVQSTKVTYSYNNAVAYTKFTATYTPTQAYTDALADVTSIRYSISQIDDVAGNTQYSVSMLGSMYFYHPFGYTYNGNLVVKDIELSDVRITTSNANDGTRYAKNGDTIYVTVDGAHELQYYIKNSVDQFSICDSDANPSIRTRGTAKVSGYGITAQMACTTFNNICDDQTPIYYKVQAIDPAGNITSIVTTREILGSELNEEDVYEGEVATTPIENSNGHIIYYAPITVDWSSFFGGCIGEYYTNNGCYLFLRYQTNHEVTTSSATFNQRNASVIARVEYANYWARYDIPQDEEEMEEGLVWYAILLRDAAGNVSSGNNQFVNYKAINGGFVTYDRTMPKISVTPILNSTSDESVSIQVVVNDLTIDWVHTSVKLDGEELLTSKERQAMQDDDILIYQFTIDTSRNNEYELSVSAQDWSGNDPVSLTMTIDVEHDKDKTVVTYVYPKDFHFPTGMRINDLLYITKTDKDIDSLYYSDRPETANAPEDIGLIEYIMKTGGHELSAGAKMTDGREIIFAFDLEVVQRQPGE